MILYLNQFFIIYGLNSKVTYSNSPRALKVKSSTDIAEVIGPNLVQAWILWAFLLLIMYHNC